MSLKELQEDFNKIIKPQLEEILRLLKTQQAQDVTSNIEAAAAKIITELRSTIQDCHCNEEILIALQGKEIVPVEPLSKSEPWKYSYPNFSVGNEDLGTGKNPGSLTWPFDADKKKA